MVLTASPWGIPVYATSAEEHVRQVAANFPSEKLDVRLPSAMEIAGLAAQQRFAHMSPQEAAKAAVDLYFACQETLLTSRENMVNAGKASLGFAKFKRPLRWPGTLDDFLRLIVRGKDQTQNLPRIKTFILDCIRHSRLRQQLAALNEADELDAQEAAIKAMKAKPEEFFSEDYWPWLAYAYRNWWAAKQQANKERAGRERAKAYKRAHKTS
jgi:hypothetical protein